MAINKEVLGMIKQAHRFFENNPGANAYIKYRTGDEKYIDHIIEKNSWYRGDGYHLFDGIVYAATFQASFIADLCEQDNKVNAQDVKVDV